MQAEAIARVLRVVADRRGIDFRDYRSETLMRGVAMRMSVTRIATTETYVARLSSDPGEVNELVRALLIPVTEFFRDEGVFRALATTVLPSFARSRPPNHLLRVWSVGTATGEEAWSMAMLLEQSRHVFSGADYELVATDLDDASLARAERGVYAWRDTGAVPEPMRTRYFVRDGDMAVVHPSLRARTHFVHHDIVGRAIAPTRAVVASFDIILLRNVLIYFDRRLQTKALERVGSMVEPGGALVLGLVETLPAFLEYEFDVFPMTDASERIFRRRFATDSRSAP